jgi:hypothetical protein
MIDKYTKLILAGILCCLIVIAVKPQPVFKLQGASTSPPSEIRLNSPAFIQIDENTIGIKDPGSATGNPEQLLLFEYEKDTKNFKYVNTFNYADYLNHPEKYGIPKK